jgi:ribosome-associated protein
LARAIRIAEGIEIPTREVSEAYSRASGPGGQHVNKTETRVTLRFSLAESASIPEADRARMLVKLAHRITKAGELLVSTDRHRDRSQNLREAYERLAELLRAAYAKPRPRQKTRPTKGSRERRLDQKRATSDRKRTRRTPPREE